MRFVTIVGADPNRIAAALEQVIRTFADRPPLYGDGHEAKRIGQV